MVPAPPEPLCTVTDPRLAELSGLAVTAGPTGESVWAADDGGRSVQIHRLDTATCAIVETRTADIDPFDTEDLAVGPDGALWVGDLGDNERRRETVAVVVVPPAGEPRLHRLAYPDGPHDAEALLVDAAGVPHVVTKEVGRPAGVYRTDGPPEGAGPIPLVRVAEVSLPPSDTTGGPIGGLGSRTVTGAAASADGAVVALRSYTDAWLYPVPDGDLVAALGGSPVRIPLPGEPQGEAIAFTGDGTLLSASEARGGTDGPHRAVPGAVASAGESSRAPVPQAEPGPAATPPAADPEPATPDWMPAAVGAAAAAGFLVLLVLLMALRRRT